VDAEGHTLAGSKDGASRSVVRTAAESELPWTLFVSEMQPKVANGPMAQQRFLLLGVSVMMLFLILGSYFIARAIRREAEAQRMQSHFVSTVSHEFRSPVTSMRQLSEMLALGRVSEERRQVYYETLVNETIRLQRLIEGLLNFGRMEAGARQYQFKGLDAFAIVESVVCEFEPRMASAGKHIETRRTDSPCWIEADLEAVSVALRNLLDNAVKYSPEQPTVWVECGLEREKVAIRVRDRGLGITESERRTIFRKFMRGSAAVAANVKGSGLGLAMVNHIVAAHGGEIVVASELGQGSTFTMLFPAAEKA
jgi:signal transduction histidine kinase